MTDFDENVPLGTEPYNIGDDKIRSSFKAIRERLEKEHYFPANAATGKGRHKFGVGTVAERNAAITAPADGNLWLNETLRQVEAHNGTNWLPFPGYGVGTLAERNALSGQPIGYLWLASDAGLQGYVWTGLVWATLHPYAPTTGQANAQDQALGASAWTYLEDAVASTDLVTLASVPILGSPYFEVEVSQLNFTNDSAAVRFVQAQLEIESGSGNFQRVNIGAATIQRDARVEWCYSGVIRPSADDADQVFRIRVWSDGGDVIVNDGGWPERVNSVIVSTRIRFA